MTHIRDTVIINCITIGIIVGFLYCSRLQVERKISLEGMVSIFSLRLVSPFHL